MPNALTQAYQIIKNARFWYIDFINYRIEKVKVTHASFVLPSGSIAPIVSNSLWLSRSVHLVDELYNTPALALAGVQIWITNKQDTLSGEYANFSGSINR